MESGKLIKLKLKSNSSEDPNKSDELVIMIDSEDRYLTSGRNENNTSLLIYDVVDRIIISEIQPG